MAILLNVGQTANDKSDLTSQEVMLRVLLDRIEEKADELLSEEQA